MWISLKAWSPYSRKGRKHVLATMFQRAYYSSPCVNCKSLVRDCYYQKHALPCEKLPLNRSYDPHWESGPWIVAAKISSIIPSVAIIAAGRNWTIDYSAGQACNVVIKVFTLFNLSSTFPRRAHARPNTVMLRGLCHRILHLPHKNLK